MTASAWSGWVLAAALVAAGDVPGDPLGEQKETAKALLEAMSKGDNEAAGKAFDETVRKILPPEKVGATWKMITDQLGAFQKLTDVRAEKAGGHDFVYLTCRFAKQTVDLKVSFDKEKRIAGFFIVPNKPRVFPDPPYAKRDDFREEEVVVGEGGEWPLPGTLTLPKGAGPFPAVVLLHGSGPHDRDETVFANKPFRDLAWGLAPQGVAVLRFEKRTREHGPKFVAKNTYTIQAETIDDARAAVALLRARKEIDPKRIFVAGHSLGAVAAPRVGEQEPELAGVILLAGNSRPLEDLVAEQFTYIYSLKGEPSDGDRKHLEKIKQQVARVKDPALSAETPRADLPLRIPAEFWLELRAHDAVAAAAKLKMPVLVLQGERDYQVTMEDFAGWKKALAGRPNVTLKSYPALNHLFLPGTGKSKPEEYDRPGHVAREVVDDVAAWVKAH
jgi:dienelactone hydrolase